MQLNNHSQGKEKFIVALNFSAADQFVDVPFSFNITWTDLLNNESFTVSNYRLTNQKINFNWGRIFYAKVNVFASR
ncbi:hypothetical protein ACN4EK_05430 [Pantanalinema rosaneae CENA516]|uniref:hypothetical protein n=1 Tax=Pantanalinema rosaneae TaxID=1620701 RepID=UPI003D6E8B29